MTITVPDEVPRLQMPAGNKKSFDGVHFFGHRLDGYQRGVSNRSMSHESHNCLTAFPLMDAISLSFVKTPDTVNLGGVNIMR